MDISKFLWRRSTAMIALSIFVSGCDQSGALLIPDKLPSCSYEREVEAWIVTASLEKDGSSDTIVNKWDARRSFSTFFGFGVTYDSSENPAPYLRVWHDYKSGEFVMRLEGYTHFRMILNAQYAVTSGTLPDGVFELISRQPVRIEHTSNTNKWSVYETNGLPEAIEAAKADLEAAKLRLANGECRA